MTDHPPLGSRSVRLRPVRTTDVDWLYHLLTFEAGSRWRYRGRTPSHADFLADLWRGVHAQFVVCTPEAEPVGLVGLYNLNQSASHCHLFAVAATNGGALVTEACGLVIDWAFDELDVDKLWIEAPEFNLLQFASLERYATVEGRLRNHDHWRGRFWDLLILSVERTRWVAAARPTVDRTRGPLAGAAVDEIDRLVGEVWPPDSLLRVELHLAVEELAGCPVPAAIVDLVAGLPADEAAARLREVVEDLRARGQQPASGSGRVEANGHDPSSVTCAQTSSGPGDTRRTTRQPS